MFAIIAVLTGAMFRVFRSRRNLLLENLVLRRQLAVLKRKRPRPRIAAFDKLFLGSCAKVVVRLKTGPDHRVPRHCGPMAPSRIPLYWRAISRARRVFGRKRISKEVRDLIFRMVGENPNLGSAADTWRASDARV